MKKKSEEINKKLLFFLNKHLKKYNKKANVKMLNIPLYQEGIIDSFDFINIIVDIEKEFKIKIPVSKISPKTTMNNLKNEIK